MRNLTVLLLGAAIIIGSAPLVFAQESNSTPPANEAPLSDGGGDKMMGMPDGENKARAGEIREKLENMTPEERKKFVEEKKAQRAEKYNNATPEQKAKMDERKAKFQERREERKERREERRSDMGGNHQDRQENRQGNRENRMEKRGN